MFLIKLVSATPSILLTYSICAYILLSRDASVYFLQSRDFAGLMRQYIQLSVLIRVLCLYAHLL